jgi:biopolymer transport protein ExbD
VSRFRKAEDEEAEIDLTPMLDVVFIMLIFFIVTASFIKESGIEISRPDDVTDAPPPDSDKQNIIIQITAADEVWIQGRRIDKRAVRANIERMYAENPDASVIIQANNKAHASVYADIANSAREAGIYAVSMVTTEF